MKRPLSMEIRTLDLRDGCEMPRNQWEAAARELEADLEAANLRNIELTSRLDRALYEAREATGRLTAVDKSLFAAMAVVHFFDGLHAHALRGRIANQRRELRRLNVRMKRDAESIKELSHRLIDADMELSDIRELCASAGCEDPEECAAPAFAMVEELRQRGVCLRESPCTPPFPAATATFDGWKVGDACEVQTWRLWHAGTIVSLGTLHGDEEVAEVRRVSDGEVTYHDVRELRRPIPPSEPTPCATCDEAPCEDGCPGEPAIEPSGNLGEFAEPSYEERALLALEDARRDRDKATARAERAERTLQRVRAVCASGYDAPYEVARDVLAILNEESGR